MPLIRSVRGFTPKIADNVFIAETAVIIGDVEIEEGASIWYNVVLRGDVGPIRIGRNSNIQDGAVVHATYNVSGTYVAKGVTVGHSAVLHGCILKENVLIGMGAIVMDNAEVGPDSIVAPGSVVRERAVVESRSLYGGTPAKKLKELDDKMVDHIRHYARNYLMYSDWFRSTEDTGDDPNDSPTE